MLHRALGPTEVIIATDTPTWIHWSPKHNTTYKIQSQDLTLSFSNGFEQVINVNHYKKIYTKIIN